MSNYPLIKLTIAFIIGIILQKIFNLTFIVSFTIFTISLILFIILLLISKHQFINSLWAIVTIMAFALCYLSSFQVYKVVYPFSRPKINNAFVYGTISSIELIRKGRLSFEVITDSIYIPQKTLEEESGKPVSKNYRVIGNYKLLSSLFTSQNDLQKIYDQLSIGNKVLLNCSIQRPRGERNPFEFDFEKYVYAKGINALAILYKEKDLSIVENSQSYLSNKIWYVRKALNGKIEELHNKTTASFLKGIVLGDRSEIDAQTNMDFINAGVVHVLSVSGLHVGYIVIIFLFLFNRFGLHWRIILTIASLVFYMILTGSTPPVVRSTLMVSLLIIAPITSRNYYSYNSIFFAALIILMFNPNQLFNPSFQLSFSALLSLVIFFPLVNNYVKYLGITRKWVKNSLLYLGTTLGAQIGTLPFVLVYFNKISVASLIANVFVIPLSGMVVALGFTSLITSTFSIGLASIYASSNELFTYILFYLVNLLGNPKYSFIQIGQFSYLDSILFYLFIASSIYFLKGSYSIKAKIIIIGLSTAIFALFLRLDNQNYLERGKLTIAAIDIGQGDSFLIHFPNGQNALIDAGNASLKIDNGKRVILPLLKKLGIDSLDFAFISHVDSDHYAGFLSLIDMGIIKSVFKPLPSKDSYKDLNLERLIHQKGIKLTYFHRNIIDAGGAKIYCLNDTIFDNYQKLSSNEKSGMIKLVYGKTNYLFTGDAGQEMESKYLRRYGEFIKSSVLKVAHHGSSSSSSFKFLQAVAPKIAIISAGVGNKFNHPSRKVIKNLEDIKSKIYRTDLLGALILSSNGNDIEIKEWKSLW